MFAEAVNQTVGIGVGIFLGTLIGFGLRARKGNAAGLVQGSVWKTAVVAGMLAWFLSALIAMFT
ncbi:hypothetical protein [Tropicibacter naphthalenivorans]|uniref:Uncharacterized protein n=1 Tax=Tropicibacter naphthalenivorans TaxID=441103 RepID=A0A0P1G4Z6_9RHOB|nr:hypothetical protein [Tropicibacter naphthalenivorans]CUH76792.1 hypothetical protein TRN7648_01128 [Tropicibacter naphthalenivorans]SMC62954.1 hypothetical protein SAMN04488093_102490 [Tropicibacter naphthalenivorans]